MAGNKLRAHRFRSVIGDGPRFPSIAHAQESKTAQVEGDSPIGRPESVHGRREPTVAATEAIPQCPTCDGPMVKRVARRGASAGKAFWGCAEYPKCRGTREM